MLANMASSLIKHGRIETTLAKAKVLRGLADRLVTLGKSGTLAARRRAISLIRDKGAVKIAFDELAGRFGERKGGYTRVMKLGYRHGDSAPMAIIEYLTEGAASAAHVEKTAAKAAKATVQRAGKRQTEKRSAKPRAGKSAKAPAKGKSAAKKTPASRARKSGRGD